MPGHSWLGSQFEMSDTVCIHHEYGHWNPYRTLARSFYILYWIGTHGYDNHHPTDQRCMFYTLDMQYDQSRRRKCWDYKLCKLWSCDRFRFGTCRFHMIYIV